jgi:tetratricopeptide (TPR) repeat protein
VPRLCQLVPLLAVACSAPPPPPATAVPRPAPAPIVQALPAGTRLATRLHDGLPDEHTWRAAAIWWREALRQSARFEVADAPAPRDRLPIVELAAAPATASLRAQLVPADGAAVTLAEVAIEHGDLCGAIDRLAWAARMALGDTDAATPPVGVAAAVGADAAAVAAADDGFALLRDGGVAAARRVFGVARAREGGGSPFVLDGLATVELLVGDLARAERTCSEALSFTARLAPTTQHRLARTLLLARASATPQHAADHDRQLLQLGEVGRRERPHDPQPVLTAALAHNLLGDFAAARPLLVALLPRLPDTALVPYHLGWACLGLGDPAAACDQLELAAPRLPMPWTMVPRAIAWFSAGRHDDLQRGVQEALAGLGPRDTGLALELHRIAAAHAVLQGDLDRTRRECLGILQWLVRHPELAAARAGEIAETGEVLVRLGAGDGLAEPMAALQAHHARTIVADAAAYVAGLLQVQRTGQRADAIETQLGHGGDHAFAFLLAAFAHEQRGELADQHRALGRALQLSSAPLAKAVLARCLQRMGRGEEAAQLRATLRGELTTLRLRARMQHPLLGPELALAFRLE